MGINKTVAIDENFFCDGSCTVLLSQSIGGSGIDAHTLAGFLWDANPEKVEELVERGVCLPICFDCDCALDNATLFVLGDLDNSHEQAWIARLAGKLSIPCGKLVLVAGGADGDELAGAVSGKPADENYCYYQSVDVPPGDYCVEILAYVESPTIGLMHEDLDEDEIQKKYKKLPQVEESYVIRLTPLQGEVPDPAPVDESGWLSAFKPRQ